MTIQEINSSLEEVMRYFERVEIARKNYRQTHSSLFGREIGLYEFKIKTIIQKIIDATK